MACVSIWRSETLLLPRETQNQNHQIKVQHALPLAKDNLHSDARDNVSLKWQLVQTLIGRKTVGNQRNIFTFELIVVEHKCA